MTEEEIERLKSEQPDYKHAFVMKDGGAKRMNQTRKIDTKLLRHQRDTIINILGALVERIDGKPTSSAGLIKESVGHLDGILNFIDDTLDTVEEHGSMTLELGGEE
jgi:hypothetical protein